MVRAGEHPNLAGHQVTDGRIQPHLDPDQGRAAPGSHVQVGHVELPGEFSRLCLQVERQVGNVPPTIGS